MAEGLAQAGAEVVLVGRNEEKANAVLNRIDSKGGTGYFEPADVSKKEEVENLLTRVLERSGNVDIVINGAGINSATPFF